MYVWWWMGGTNPDLTTCPVNTPSPTLFRQSLTLWSWEKKMTWMLFSWFCFKLCSAFHDHVIKRNRVWFVTDVLYTRWTQISAAHVSLQDEIHSWVRVRRFKGLSRISACFFFFVFFFASLPLCAWFCVYVWVCVSSSFLSVWCSSFYGAISWTVAGFHSLSFKRRCQ